MGNGIVKPNESIRSKDNQSINQYITTNLTNYLSKYLLINKNLLVNQSCNNNDISNIQESFMDSFYIKNWLSINESNNLYKELVKINDREKPIDFTNASKSKYPLWTKYYGIKRKLDGARALDRWGSYHESWLRIEEPPRIIADMCNKIRMHCNLSDDSVNSIVVNYYYDGDNTYIPAHRDTIACLEDNSLIFCLSLGSSRDFVFCDNKDAGKYVKNEMKITKEFRVSHGDLFAIGSKTNESYLHAITKESSVKDLRISIVFRSVNKCFVDNNSMIYKEAIYMNGTKKLFNTESIITKGYYDLGKREHIADLINEREKVKLQRLSFKLINYIKDNDIRVSEPIEKDDKSIDKPIDKPIDKSIEIENDITKYYLGVGVTVPQ